MDKVIYEEKAMHVKDVREFLGISKEKAYALFHQADFPCVKLGRDMIILKSDLIEWVKRHKHMYVDLAA